jgi:glyoxylase-like metal-dependent hydrolase (beta-lactamase superfamily II)
VIDDPAMAARVVEGSPAMTPVAVHACNPGPVTGAGNWTWLLTGRVPTLIDAGTGDARHLAALQQALGGATLAQVLVTHAHGDHASGAIAIAERVPGVRFLKMPWPDRDAKWPVGWLPVADGDVIAAGDTTVTAVHTPGHAPDHLCFWHQESRTLFGGDLAVLGSTVWIPTSLQGDLSEYLSSLERVLALAPARILPAHGAPIEEPSDLLRGYIRHRQEREAQILSALRAGETSPDAIVERLYQGVKERLLPFARESVLAHLAKLERQGAARRAGEAWHIIEP